MTKAQNTQQLMQKESGIQGKDVPQSDCARVIDNLCNVIVEKDIVIADQKTLIAAKDDAIAKLNQKLMWYKRKMFGHSSEKLHQDDPNQLLIDFEGMF